MLDCKQIPMESLMPLVEHLFKGTKKAMQDPEFKKAFEEWAKERREKQ